MIEIIPAVLPKNRTEIEDMVARYAPSSVRTIQIDLVDGSFASPKTWPYNSKRQYEEYKKLEEEGFPGWQDIDIELDLMIDNPLEQIDRFVEWGPSRIIVHASSIVLKDYIHFLESHRSIQSFIHFGIAFGVEDNISAYKEILSHIDFVQCMGIKTIGKQSQVFDVRVLEQIKKVHILAPDLPICVDGGVGPETASQLIQSGATRLVSGSYLAQAIDVEDAILKLSGEIVQEKI